MNITGYTIDSRIGAGGQAMVYLAIQESLQRRVALKVLNPLHADSDEFTARFLNEGRILANLGHSNVITIHDIGVEGGFHYISMELVEGGDLKRRMTEGISPATVLDYVRIIADCLAMAHDKNIVHRDIKPGNVLFRNDGTLLLTDFGIAKQLDDESELTLTGTTVGSPSYLSPEQAKGKPLDGRADIYSLGVMTYEMLVGQKPYKGDSDIDTIFKHINDPIPRLPQEVAIFQELIDRMMAKLPVDRFENARGLVEFLDEMKNAPEVTKTIPLHAGAVPAELAKAGAPGTQTRISGIVGSADPAGTEDAVEENAETVLGVHQFVDVDAATEVNLKTAQEGPGLGVMAVIPAVFTLLLSTAVLIAWDQTRPETVPAAEPLPAWMAADPEEPERVAARPVQSGAAPAEVEPPNTVESLLAKAEKALEDYRLTKPESNNALEYFNEVLVLDPANPVAADGYKRIAERYVDLAEREIGREDFDKAQVFVNRGLSLTPENETLQTLQQQIQTARAERPRARPKEPPPEQVGEIKGETPAELLERIKGWFK